MIINQTRRSRDDSDTFILSLIQSGAPRMTPRTRWGVLHRAFRTLAMGEPPTWAALEAASAVAVGGDRARAPVSSAQALVRLFDAPDGTVPRVTLFRDHHAWCPYCQKVITGGVGFFFSIALQFIPPARWFYRLVF